MNYTTNKRVTVDNITIELDDGCIIKLTPYNFISIDLCFQYALDNYLVEIVSNTGTHIHFTTKDDNLIKDIRLLAMVWE